MQSLSYVKPINSRYKPFDDAIAFGDGSELGSTIDLFKTLTQDNKGANAFFMLLWAVDKWIDYTITTKKMTGH